MNLTYLSLYTLGISTKYVHIIYLTKLPLFITDAKFMRHKNIRRLHHNQQLASLNEKRRQFQWKQQQKQQQSQKPKFFEKNNKKYEKLIQKPTSATREPLQQQVFHKEKQPLSPGRPQVNIYFSSTSYLTVC